MSVNKPSPKTQSFVRSLVAKVGRDCQVGRRVASGPGEMISEHGALGRHTGEKDCNDILEMLGGRHKRERFMELRRTDLVPAVVAGPPTRDRLPLTRAVRPEGIPHDGVADLVNGQSEALVVGELYHGWHDGENVAFRHLRPFGLSRETARVPGEFFDIRAGPALCGTAELIDVSGVFVAKMKLQDGFRASASATGCR